MTEVDRFVSRTRMLTSDGSPPVGEYHVTDTQLQIWELKWLPYDHQLLNILNLPPNKGKANGT